MTTPADILERAAELEMSEHDQAMTDPQDYSDLVPPMSAGPRIGLQSITRTTGRKPCKAVVYGVQGIGKTTLASGAPTPVFVPVEDGLASLDVPRFPKPESFDDAMECLRVLYREQHEYRSVVIDTLDALEPLIHAHVCSLARKASIEDFGYGKGYVHALEHWRRFLKACEMLRDHKAMHIILIAHSAVVRVTPPDSDEYDRYSLKLQKQAAAVVQEWADAVLFCQYETRIIKTETGNKTRNRAVGDGSRVMRTSERPAWAAKNRYGLPDDLPMDWAELEQAMKGPAA